MKRRFIVLLHLGYWAVYLLLLVVLLAALRIQFRQGSSLVAILLASPIGLLAIAPNVAAFYFSYWLLSKRLLAQRRLFTFFFAGIAGAVGAASAGLLVVYIWLGPDQPVFSNSSELASVVVSLALVACLHEVIAVVMRGFVEWYGDLRLKEELGLKTHEMEMALVRSKLDPHFLFNTLNNIDVLIEKDPAKASLYLHQLSDILRFVLYEAKEGRIPLTDEISYVLKYLALERIRSANPDFVDCDIRGDPCGFMIAPMTFIPFIENAFKHTEDRRSPSAVQIRLEIQDAQIRFECINPLCGAASRPASPGGLGNDLIGRRLDLLYPSRHRLDVTRDNHVYAVRLSLDLR